VGSLFIIAILGGLSIWLLLESRARARAEASQIEGEERFRVLVENAPEAILVYDVSLGLFVEANPNSEKLLGLSRAELLKTGPEPFFGTGITNGKGTLDTIASNNQKVLAGQSLLTVRDLQSADGRALVVEARVVHLPGKNSHLVRVSLTDITERRAVEARVEQLAFYDVLTGQPNRRLFYDRLRHALAACTRSKARGALLYLDLDNFKLVNDTLGHNKGDQLLLEVSQRLNKCLRGVDTAARFGGDEFVVMLEGLDPDETTAGTQAKSIGEKILFALEQPYLLDEKHYRSSASMGVAVFGATDQSADELVKRADLAMYQAKAAGRNSLRFFSPDMQAAVTQRTELEIDLNRGIQMQQFLMYLQPQVDAQGYITGAEALLRWQHPERGMVAPLQFIALAEDTGLIVPIGEWILEAACLQLLAWAHESHTAHLTLAVNVSVRQFRQANFVDRVLSILTRTQANPKRLKLELTESILVAEVDSTIGKMAMLKAYGVGFSLDDFGTGYSSLMYLKRLPLDQLKIDQSFVRDVLTDANDAAIARTVIALAKSMGLSVIAEGVETQGQREFLAQHGCIAYQGYLFGKPLSQPAFKTLVDTAAANTTDYIAI
jgi:diguanylate cyclase (GGDEF)-like protein/PAS domain S-box-containing protein